MVSWFKSAEQKPEKKSERKENEGGRWVLERMGSDGKGKQKRGIKEKTRVVKKLKEKKGEERGKQRNENTL